MEVANENLYVKNDEKSVTIYQIENSCTGKSGRVWSNTILAYVD